MTGSYPTDDEFARFKNERDLIAQSSKTGTVIAAMNWAVAEIERLRQAASVERAEVAGEAVKAAVTKHCHVNMTWPATAQIDDHHIQDFVAEIRAALASTPRSEGMQASEVQSREAIDKLIQRHASAYVARGAAISDSIVAECKASREALLAALGAAQSSPASSDRQIDAAYANGVRAVLSRLAHLRKPQDDAAWHDCEAMWRNRVAERHASSVPSADGGPAA